MTLAFVSAVLLGLNMDTEVFLRLMWGEKRAAVFAALLGAVGLWLLVCIAASVAAAYLTAGAHWLPWAAKYSAMTAIGCLMGCGIPLGCACGRNLVKSYQSREGE